MMAWNWRVDFTDADRRGVQSAAFASRFEAENWIESQLLQEQCDPIGFQVVDGPYACRRGNTAAEVHGVKIWVDAVRPPPDGYVWIKSVNDFIKFVDKNGIANVMVFDLDHAAGDYAADGGDYAKCLDYLEFIGADGISVRLHGANTAGVQRMRSIIKKNQWDEVFSIIDEGEVDECFDGGSYDDLARESVELIDEQEDTARKAKIIDALKKA